MIACLGNLLAAGSNEGSGRSRVYALSFSGVPNWTLDLDWSVGDDYAMALGSDGTAYVGGTSLGAVSTDGRLQWEIGLGSGPGGNCHPVVGVRGQVLCASGNSVQAFGKAGERIWSFQADDQEETFGPYVAVDQSGAVYAVSTRQGPAGPEGRLYALDGLGKLRWKLVLSGEERRSPEPHLFLHAEREMHGALRRLLRELRESLEQDPAAGAVVERAGADEIAV